MKKFTTTFFLLMAMVLLLPTEVGAWSDVYLFSTIDDVWSSNNKTDNDKFTKTDDNTFYKDIDATNITGDISFCLYVTDNNGFEIFPSINDDVITAEYEAHDSWSNGAYKESRNNRAWKIKHSSDRRDKYRILFRYDNNTRKFYVNVIDPESTVYDPVLEKEDEISCFVEVPSTIDVVKIWAWNGSTNYTGSIYKDRQSLDIKGYTTNGHKIFKWTYSGTETKAPSKVVFSKGGDEETDQFAKDIDFTNHGYYVYDGTNNISSYSKIITNVSGGETTPTPTSVTGKNLYLVGNFFDNETDINYHCRYFKLTDNGDNSYSIDIPATLSVNAQLLHVDGENETVYGPNSNGYGISNAWPSGNNGSLPDQPLAEGTKNLTKYWTFADRGLNSDGMYTLTVKLNEEGVPTTWSIKHDLLTRVAYFIADTEGATVHPAYSKRNNESESGNNKYFGSIYLPAGVGCYVISNITKNADTYNNSLLKTTTKFYLQGNATGNSPALGKNENTKVFPVIYNGAETVYKSFVFSQDEGLQYLLEYNPSQGENETAEKYGYVGGEVQVRQDGPLADLVVKSMKIVGPAIKGDGWDLTANALDMTYNLSENCWEVTFDTTNPAGEYFRFVANNNWKSHWIENGTTDEDKAKIPYDGTGVGQPATVAVPNEVSYTTTERAESNKEYDIIFNRNAGRWTVKFYIETESDQGGNNFKYKFRYTINGYKSILRTYCMEEDGKPTDENIKIYGAYAFDDKSGKVKLYEMNYIPANEGVILIGTGVDYVKAAKYTPKEGETKYKNIKNYKNYLVGVLVNTPVNASEFDGAGKRTGRNFFFNYLSKTDYYKDGDTDYLGFFRIKSGSTCKANYAYLRLPTTVLTWNGQTLDDVLEDDKSTLSKGIKMVFGIADEDFGSVTGINDIQKEVKTDNSYYTLQGIRVNTPSKGIYIHNGRKVVIK